MLAAPLCLSLAVCLDMLAACALDLAGSTDGSIASSRQRMSPSQGSVAGSRADHSIGGGSDYTCALRADGTVWCWGNNGSGELGNNASGGYVTTPGQVLAAGADGGTAPLSDVVGIATGTYHVCAVRSGGTVWCWGLNDHGQLGIGSTTTTHSPVAVQAGTGILTDITTVAAGLEHSCALSASGAVWCWGGDEHGQLGDDGGDGGSGADQPSPVLVQQAPGVSLGGAIGVTAGFYHSCAWSTDGTARCWGRDDYGQLGDGTADGAPGNVRLTATSVLGLSGVTSMAAGAHFTCALTADSGVQCWGTNAYGQLGNGQAAEGLISNAPVPVSGLSSVVSIAASYNTACAVLADGSTWCWGYNANCQTANPTSPTVAPGGAVVYSSPVPTNRSGGYHSTVAILAGYVGSGYGVGDALAVGMGSNHACAVRADGTVSCWGDNSAGELGNGTYGSTCTWLPVAVASPTSAPSFTGAATQPSIQTSGNHACALQADGTARCWGRNDYGQLGDGTQTNRNKPVQVVGLRGATQLAVGLYHTCAIAGGVVLCWGGNYGNFGLPDTYGGQLGDGTLAAMRSLPTIVGGTAPDGGVGATLTRAVQVAAGFFHTCALTASGNVKCWGHTKEGELGNGDTSGTPFPYVATVQTSAGVPLEGVTAIAAQGYTTCALTSGGSVHCWGSNSFGQLGTSSGSTSAYAIPVSGITAATGITVGFGHACAVLSGGTLECWGWNVYGQLGDGTTMNSSSPVAVGLSGAVLAASAGYGHTCAVTTGGSVFCWGDGADGEVGSASAGSTNVDPLQATPLGSAVGVSAGYLGTCAAISDGTAACWGWNGYGQLGNGNTTSQSVPVLVDGFSRTTVCRADYSRCEADADCCSRSCLSGLCLTDEECQAAPFAGVSSPSLVKAPPDTWSGGPDGTINQALVGTGFVDFPMSGDAGSMIQYGFLWADSDGTPYGGQSYARADEPNMCFSHYTCATNACADFCSLSGCLCDGGSCDVLSFLRANHPDWIEYQCNPDGTLPTSPDTATVATYEGDLGQVALDIANPAVIEFQLQHLAVPLFTADDSLSADSYYVHSVTNACGHFSFGGDGGVTGFVQQYNPSNQNDPQWAADAVNWLKQVRARLPQQADGGARMALAANVGSLAIQDPQNQAPDPIWLAQVAANVDTFLDEGGFTVFHSRASGKFLGAADDSPWLQRIRLMADVQRLGGHFVQLNMVENDASAPDFDARYVSSEDVQLTLASFLMGREHGAHLMVGAYFDNIAVQDSGTCPPLGTPPLDGGTCSGVDQYFTSVPYGELGAQLGHPCSCLARNPSTTDGGAYGNVYVRKFQYGVALAYPLASGSPESVSLPATCGKLAQVQCPDDGGACSSASWTTTYDGGASVVVSPQQGLVLVQTGASTDLCATPTPGLCQGDECTAGSQCQSGHCVNGYCCNTSCTGRCQACDGADTGLPNGTCGNVGAGIAAPAGQCTGACMTHKCDGSGGCEVVPAYPSVVCQPSSCSGSLHYLPEYCDGYGGNCPTQGTASCSPYKCDSSGDTCRTSCSGDSECVDGHHCSSGHCM